MIIVFCKQAFMYPLHEQYSPQVKIALSAVLFGATEFQSTLMNTC